MTSLAIPGAATVTLQLSVSRARSIARHALPGADDDKLFFAQVREDPRVEIAALRPGARDRVVVVGSGGCTALSLLSTGAGEVHAVDTNRTQNHLVELKALAVRELSRREAIAFLGGAAMGTMARRSLYMLLRTQLSPGARDFWDARPVAVNRGVIEAGVSERFIRIVAWAIRHLVHTPERVDRLLFCRSLEEQRALFDGEWNSRRWRLLFSVLLNRWTMSRAYDPRFFAGVGRRHFAGHFLQLANRALTELPVADNYFVHQMLTGYYPAQHPEGVPPFLGERGFPVVSRSTDRLLLVDGSLTDHLRTLPDGSVDAFALSNICEWLDDAGIAALFAEVERTAAPGARVVYRNFVGWTELPPSCTRLEADEAHGKLLASSDRSVVQPRVVVCRVGSGT